MPGSRRLLLAAALTLAPRPASADGVARLELSWHAPDECPSASEARTRVEEYVGEQSASHTTVKADASIAPLPDGRYQLALRLQGPELDAERSLAAASCQAATQAAALLIAMALDPALAARRASPNRAEVSAEPALPATPTPVAPPEPARPPAPTATREEPELSHAPLIGVGLGAIADLGALPGFGFGIAGELELPLSRLRLSLGGAVLPEVDRPLQDLPGSRLDMGLALATLRACVPWAAGRVEIGPCVVVEAGSLHGLVRGIVLPHSGAALWLGVGAGARARFELGSGWGVLADLGLLVPHARRAFLVLTDSGSLTVHRVAPVTLRIGAGLAYQFQ